MDHNIIQVIWAHVCTIKYWPFWTWICNIYGVITNNMYDFLRGSKVGAIFTAVTIVLTWYLETRIDNDDVKLKSMHNKGTMKVRAVIKIFHIYIKWYICHVQLHHHQQEYIKQNKFPPTGCGSIRSTTNREWSIHYDSLQTE